MKESTTQIVKSLGYRYDDISVHLKDDKVIKIEGDSQSNEAALERLYHTNRLQYPQMRLGDIHNGKWKQISWDEAFDIIAEKLNTIKNRYGAEHVAFGKGYRRPYSDYVTRLANVFGTPNVVGVGHVCYVPRAVGSLITCGYDAFPDMDYPTKCMVWWGIRGCPLLKGETKLIVVNTQKTEAAAKADVWLQPRPATDLALALGILNIIINGELYDKDFVEKWTTGFDKLKEYVQKYTPEKVAEITWVPVKKIIEAAKLYATSSPSWIKIGNAIEDNLNSVQCARALSIMSAITGNLDIPGGDIEIEGAINNLGGADITLPDKLPRRKQIKKIGAPHGFLPYHPLWDLAATMPLQVHPQVFVRAVLEENPYPIKAFCIFGSNPLLTWSNVNKVYSALKKLEFLVVADFVMTPTARLAHIVLPVASYLEQDSVIIPASRLPVIKVGRQVTRIGECRSDFEIIIELAKKLGLRKYFWEDVNSFLDAQLEPIGMTFEEFQRKGIISVVQKYRKYIKKGFNTPSHKVEIFSSLFQQWGYDPLPEYNEPPETPYSNPEMVNEYPLILTSCHEDYYVHSQDRHLKTLRKIKPDPVTIIHPETAKKLGIEDEDMVYIETKRGRIKQKASLNLGINPKVVSVAYGWWFPEKGATQLYRWKDSNINILTDDKPPYNREMGSTNLRGFLCKVYKA